MSSLKIVITGAFRFPDQDAAAARVLALGKALRASGHQVVFCGWEAESRSDDADASGNFRYQGFEYHSQAEFRTARLNPVRRLWSYLTAGRNTIRWLREQPPGGVDAIIAYHGRSLFLLRLMWFCRNRGIRLLFDCTEWYGSPQLVGGSLGVDSLDNAIRMRVIYPIIGHGIVISNYLQDYYVRRGAAILILPPMVDMSESKWATPSPAIGRPVSVSLVYAGSPGKKDLLDLILVGMAQALDAGIGVTLDILGPSREEVLKLLGDQASLLERLNDSIQFLGRVPQSQVPGTLSKADFSVLLRRDDRHSQAGFPTKVVESLAVGLPVICNYTSDLAKYLTDGDEGIRVERADSDSFAKALIRAAKLSLDQRASMRLKARRLAREAFDYRPYALPLNDHVSAAPTREMG